MAADHLGALHETAQRARERRRPLDRAVRDAGAERDLPVRLDTGEPGHALETDHVARGHPPRSIWTIRSVPPARKLPSAPKRAAERDRVGQALGLVVLEAAHAAKSLALTCGGQIDAEPVAPPR